MDFQRWLDLIRQSGGDPSHAPLAWLENEFKAGVSPAVAGHKLQGMKQASQMQPPPPLQPPVQHQPQQVPYLPQQQAKANSVWGVMTVGCVVAFGLMLALCAGFSTIGGSRNEATPVKPAPETAAQKAAREKVAAETAEKAKKEAELKAWIRKEEQKRGKYPIASAWDGITPEVNAYLKASLRDYDSMEIVACYEVITFGDNAWAQRVKYRAKNGFGGTNLVTQLFVIQNGAVIDVIGDSR